MRALSLFTGIGGLDLAAEIAGVEIAAMCEIEPFCVSILGKRWPQVPLISDVRSIDGNEWSGKVDIVFGGFPCQDLSTAKQQRGRKGLEGERSGLWHEMARIIREARPLWVLAENVRGAVNLALDTVTETLEALGYETRAFILPCSAYGAPHKRERLFVLGRRDVLADAISVKCSRGRDSWTCAKEGPKSFVQGLAVHGFEYAPLDDRRGVFRDTRDKRTHLNPDWVEQMMAFPEGWTDPSVDEPKMWQGFPRKMVLLGEEGSFYSPQWPYEFPRLTNRTEWRSKRLKALGNSVCPMQVYPLFRAIVDFEKLMEADDEKAYSS